MSVSENAKTKIFNADFQMRLHAGYGHFAGNTHWYTRKPLQIGRIKRARGQSLCGALSDRIEEVSPFRENVTCARCREIASRITRPRIENIKNMSAYTDEQKTAVPGFDIVLSLARMAVGNAKPEAFAAVRHQVMRLRQEMERLGHDYQAEKLTQILAEGPSPTEGQRLIRSSPRLRTSRA